MSRTTVNPWTWQEKFGFSQAVRVDAARSLLFLAGQGPLDAEGAVVDDDDFHAQVRTTFENVATVLAAAGATWSDVVKMTTYLTDIGRLADYARIRTELLADHRPASTVVEVSGFAFAGMQIEVDIVAAL